MPKRKHSEEDHIQKKIKKLQKKLNKKRLKSVSSRSDSDTSEIQEMTMMDYGADTPTLKPSDWLMEDEVTDDNQIEVSAPATQTEFVTNSSPQTVPSVPDPIPQTDDTVVQENTGLDSDILEILGEDPSDDQKYGPEIRGELANRLNHITSKGLSKEVRKDLMTKYPTPSNCKTDAPKLNKEIKAAILELGLKRDKGIEAKQKQMASAIAGLSDVINNHIESKSKNNELLKKLMDICRIICDIQYADSVTRRNFILFSLKGDMTEHLKSTNIDTFLFGEDLPETIKTGKAVIKSGAELKAVKPAGPRQPRYNPAGQKPLPLNRRAPTQARRMPGPAHPPPPRQPYQRRDTGSRYHTTHLHPPPPVYSSKPSLPQRANPPLAQRRRQ